MPEMKPTNNDAITASDLEGARRVTGKSLAGKASAPDPQVTAKTKLECQSLINTAGLEGLEPSTNKL